ESLKRARAFIGRPAGIAHRCIDIRDFPRTSAAEPPELIKSRRSAWDAGCISSKQGFRLCNVCPIEGVHSLCRYGAQPCTNQGATSKTGRRCVVADDLRGQRHFAFKLLQAFVALLFRDPVALSLLEPLGLIRCLLGSRAGLL